MAFGRLERSARPAPMSDINMTPLIDVMLVLLVIFIVTAPLMTSSLALDLPKSDAARPSETPDYLAVSIDPAGKLFLDEKEIDAAGLAQRVAETARLRPQTEVQLRADQAVPYGRVAELIGVVQKGGLTRIGFVAERGASGPSR